MSVLFQAFKETACQFGNKTAIFSDKKQISYQSLLSMAELWSKTLTSLDSSACPTVGLLTEDAVNTATLSLAVAKITATCVPTNPQLTPTQLVDGWLSTKVNIVVFEPDFAQKVQQCRSLLNESTINFISVESFPSLLSQDTGMNVDKQVNTAQSNKTHQHFIITLSSGSTGSPKPIAISQQCKLLRAQQSWQLYNITPDDVILCASPFFHSLGQRLFFVPLLLGATLVQLKQFTPQAWIAAVEEHKVSKVISVSSHLYALKDVLLSNAKQLSSLKTIVTSSAPIDNHFKKQLFESIGCDFHEMYGATEVATATNLYPKFSQEKHSSVGTACPNVSIKILAEDKTELLADQIGEIAVKSPLAFTEYYQKDELTKAAFFEDYFLTGDLGKIGRDGFLSYVGRKKDIIISGGINVYPKDIETALTQHTSLKEIAVIGVDDEFLGEVILAICVVENGVANNTDINENECSDHLKLVERELRRIANKKLAPFQRPLKYFFRQSLPLTASGKISKLALRDHYSELSEDWSAPLRAMLYR